MSLCSSTGVAINLAITLSLAGVLGALHGQTAAERDGYARAHQEWRETRQKLERRRRECSQRLASEKARDQKLGQELAGLDVAIAAAKAETGKKHVAIDARRKALGELRSWLKSAGQAMADLDKELTRLLRQVALESASIRLPACCFPRPSLADKAAAVKEAEQKLADLEREHQLLLDKKQRLMAWFKKLPGCGIDAEREMCYLPPSGLRGRVEKLAHEAPECSISLGKNDGVSEGMKFTVSRGDQYIGLVEVQKVFPATSTARFIVEMTARGKKIEAGDVVRTSFEVR